MGEKTHREKERIAAGLSDPMASALRAAAVGGGGYARFTVLGSGRTITALATRGLIRRPGDRGAAYYLTALGREVLRLVAGTDVVKTIDELHAEALDDARQREAPAATPSFAVGDLVTIPSAPDNWLKWKIVQLHGEPYPRAQVERRHLGGHAGVRIYSLTVPLRDLRHVEREDGVALDLDRRIIKRAKYDALRELLSVLDGWVAGARENHVGLEHRGEPVGLECWTRFHPDDIRRMVNDAARGVGCREPYRPPVKP